MENFGREKTNLYRIVGRDLSLRWGSDGAELIPGPPEGSFQVAGIVRRAQTFDPLCLPQLLGRHRGQVLFCLQLLRVVFVSEAKIEVKIICRATRPFLRGGRVRLNKRKLEEA